MDVSIIIPFYNGERFLESIKKCITENAIMCSGDISIELIIVNDSPWCVLDYKEFESTLYRLKIITNNENIGIHASRVNGLNNASGDYIVFLDQDDYIDQNFILHMYKAIDVSSYSFVFCNGIYYKGNQKTLILNSFGRIWAAKKYSMYFIVRNCLASPGQCIIRRKSIPESWKDNIMSVNCADDMLLWILILKEGSAGYVNESLYIHNDTGDNVSINKTHNALSGIELCDILEKKDLADKRLVKILRDNCVARSAEDFSKIYEIYARRYEYLAKMYIKSLGMIKLLGGNRLPTIK